MEKFIALLRGININGKSRIAMSELKENFKGMGYTAISTYLNSGNVVFSCDENNKVVLSSNIQMMIKRKFELDIPVFIISQQELEDIVNNAPCWWGNSNKDIYDNLIFLFPTISYDQFHDELGKPNEAYEKVHPYKNTIFWSFDRKNYQKTNWWSKTASSKVGAKITIRTANTIKKIVDM